MTSASVGEPLSVGSGFRHIKKYVLISPRSSRRANCSFEHSDSDIDTIVE